MDDEWKLEMNDEKEKKQLSDRLFLVSFGAFHLDGCKRHNQMKRHDDALQDGAEGQ